MRVGGIVALALVLAGPLAAAAADPAPVAEAPLDETLSLGWRQGTDRWFAAGLIDFGPLYLRPRLSVGWGRPFWRWVGVDANPLASGEGVGAYAGARVTTPHLDLRAGARWFSTFSRTLLEPRYSFNRLALDVRSGPVSQYLSLEAELTGSLPVGPGTVLCVLIGTYVALVPEDHYVYEDSLRLITAPPWIWVARTGYELAFAAHDRARLGVVAELIGSPRRDLVVVRGGLTGSLKLADILELRAALVPALLARDDLGAMGGQWFELGLRFRFATGAAADLQLPSM
jgi:hypothetical protein